MVPAQVPEDRWATDRTCTYVFGRTVRILNRGEIPESIPPSSDRYSIS